MDGGRLFRYQFQVPPESSHYRIHAGGDWRITGYSGTVSIDPDSFKLRRLIVRTSELPEETGACEAATTVEYASVRIGTGDFPLPRHSDLHILLRDTAERETSTMYSACRQFVGEANLVAAPAKEAGEQPKLRRDPISIPAGLPVLIALAAPIDTDTAAAGDVFAARTVKAVGDIPARSAVRGRIVGMEHWQDAPRHFVIALQLETGDGKRYILPRGYETK